MNPSADSSLLTETTQVKNCTPSLVPLLLSDNEETAELSGLSLKNVNLSLYMGNKLLYEELGELLFTHKGISGPLVLTASSIVGEELLKKSERNKGFARFLEYFKEI